jgi:hypothetical protein
MPRITQPQAGIAGLAIAVFLLAPVSDAHAILVKATPAANSVVSGSALTISLTFNSRIDGRRSRLTIVGPDGAEHDLTLQTDRAPQALAARPGQLTPGSYRLRWQVLALDGHITRGEIPFRVEAGKP